MASNNSPNKPGEAARSNQEGSRGGGSNPSNPDSNSPAGSETPQSRYTEEQLADQTRLSFEGFKRGSSENKSILSYPNSLKSIDSTDYVRFSFKKYKPPFSSGGARGSQGGYNESITNLEADDELSTIALYMPEDIQAQYGAQWNGKAFQNVTANILQNSGLVATGNVGESLKNLGTTVGSLGESGFTKLVTELVDKLQKSGQAEGLGTNDIFGSTAGIVLNPNTELLFQGFDLRTINLTFKMVPNNDTEAVEIRQIITNFKRAMLPRLNTGTFFADNADGGSNQDDSQNFIKVPNLVEMRFMSGGVEHPYLTQFKPCAITGLSINYTPDGSYSTYRNSSPVATIMQVSLAETKLVYREDIYDGPSF